LEIDADGLPDPALPVPDADDGLDAQVAQKHDVQEISFRRQRASVTASRTGRTGSAGGSSSSSDQRGRATIPGAASRLAAAARQAPACAIIAPLSVQSAGRG